jgi:hypothetical protein
LLDRRGEAAAPVWQRIDLYREFIMRNYDDDPILVNTSYNLDRITKFNEVHLKTNLRVKPTVFAVVFIILTVALYGIQRQAYYPGGLLPIRELIPPAVSLGMFWILYQLVKRSRPMKRLQMKRYGKIHKLYGSNYIDKTDEMLFVSESFTSKTDISCNTVKYKDLFRIVETPEMFYLYSAKLHAYLVDKHGVRNGTAYELRTLLQSRVAPEKYKFINK